MKSQSMKEQITDKFMDEYLILRDTAKFAGIKDTEKLFWYEHLIYCDYNEMTNHCFWGYLEGVGTHDRTWMLERYKELIKEGKADCIRFIDLISCSELDELIAVCSQNNISTKERSYLIHVFCKLLKNIDGNCSFDISIGAQISFLNLLLDVANQHGSIIYESSTVYQYFIPRLIITQETESAATNVFSKLIEYWRDIAYPQQKKFIESMMDLVKVRFSNIRNRYEKEKSQIIEDFFNFSLGDYLSSHKAQFEEFKTSFPRLNSLFVEPLNASSFSKSLLYRFFCEPIFFRKILIFVHLPLQDRNRLIYLKQLADLEGFFETTSRKADCSDFLKKVSKFVELMSSNSLNNILGDSFGLHGEINNLQKAWELQASSVYSSHIEIPLEPDSKRHKKIGDIRLHFPHTKSYQCFESKCKKPGLGFDGDESKLNDYLMNVIPLISGYVNICIPSIDMMQLFPRLVVSNKHIFGRLSDLIHTMSEKGIRVTYSENELSDSNTEKNVLKSVLECFYDNEFIMSEGYLLPTDEEILNHKKNLADILFAKKFLRNTLKESLKKFRDEKERAKENNLSIDSFVICWTLFTPDCLIYSPFFTQDSFTVDLVNHIRNGIREIFNDVLLSHEFSDLQNQKVELMFL